MHGELTITAGTLSAFLLVMARMGGMLVFLPMPGLRYGPPLARIILAVASAFLVYPLWPHGNIDPNASGRFLGAMIAEAGLGIAVGLCVACFSEALVLSAQIVSLQAGYSYASTIDPTTEAEAGYLVIVAQLFAGLLFFGLGLDRQVLLVLARSLTTLPPGSFVLSRSAIDVLSNATALIFSTSLRLVLPVSALLVMTDITLALLGRLHSQLQVTSLAFPAKMLGGLGLLAWVAVLFPRACGDLGQHILEAIYRLVR